MPLAWVALYGDGTLVCFQGRALCMLRRMRSTCEPLANSTHSALFPLGGYSSFFTPPKDFSNARKITSLIRLEISFQIKEENLSLAGQVKVF
jgi:hypothetical protein